VRTVTRFWVAFFLLTTTLFPPRTALASSLIDLQRGIHGDFELIVFYADTMPEFRLYYDRVLGEVRLESSARRMSERVARQLAAFTAGITVQSVEFDRETGALYFKVRGTVYLRQYLVNGPPALLLDFSRGSDAAAQLPYELGRNEYLLMGGIEEREGRFDNALRYLDRAQKNSPGDLLVEHRAGIIRQRLGRYDEALANFTVTGRNPEFAADAHARRAMILLLRGDTTQSGDAWSEYFRQPTAGFVSADTGKGTTTVKTGTELAEHKGEGGKEVPINAGTGSNMLIGWALLVVGAAALAGLMISPAGAGFSLAGLGGNGRAHVDYEPEPPPPRRVERDRPIARRFSRIEEPEPPAPMPYTSDVAVAEPLMTATSRRQSTAQMTAPSEPPRHIPTEYILSRAQAGASELEIAREFSMGRDEVAMILNLAQMGQRMRGRG